MGTNIRPEISERNPYWISKHRYYELKHFCLQYNGWASAYKALDGKTARPLLDGRASGEAGDPTEKCAERRVYYGHWFRKGLKFEETGSITSSMMRNLINKFRTKK